MFPEQTALRAFRAEASYVVTGRVLWFQPKPTGDSCRSIAVLGIAPPSPSGPEVSPSTDIRLAHPAEITWGHYLSRKLFTMDTCHNQLLPSGEDVFLHQNKPLPQQTEQRPQVGKVFVGFWVFFPPFKGSCRTEQEGDQVCLGRAA